MTQTRRHGIRFVSLASPLARHARWFGAAAVAVLAALVLGAHEDVQAHGASFPYHESDFVECTRTATGGLMKMAPPPFWGFKPYYGSEWVFWWAELEYSRDGTNYYRAGYRTPTVAAWATHQSLHDFSGFGSYWLPVDANGSPYIAEIDPINQVPSFGQVSVPRGYIYRFVQTFLWSSTARKHQMTSTCLFL